MKPSPHRFRDVLRAPNAVDAPAVYGRVRDTLVSGAVLAKAAFVIRSRRPIEDAEVLLDECLALLEAAARKPSIAGGSSLAPGAERHADSSSGVDELVPELDGRSPAMRRLKDDLVRVARDAHVSALILGESGTGKERVARAIHRLSSRASRPFVVVNCAGLSPTLAEDELFGHVRGAFTGAINNQAGPFERANGGTVFLDEIGELTLDLQMKLLRALQQRIVQRLGSAHETRFDVRVIAATNADLAAATARGRFRQDLYYRLKVFELCMPPLRHRGTLDLRSLCEAILQRLSAQRHRPAPTLAPAVWEAFSRHRWPGNVRELENTLERMIVAAGDDALLTTGHLPDDFAMDVEKPASIPRVLPGADEARAALQRNGFRSGRTASELGLSRHQLYRLLKRHAAAAPSADRALA